MIAVPIFWGIVTIALAVLFLLIWKQMTKSPWRTLALFIVGFFVIGFALNTVLGASYSQSVVHIVESTPTLMSYPPK